MATYDERMFSVTKIRTGALRALGALVMTMTLASTTAAAMATHHSPRHHAHRSHHPRGRLVGIPQHNGGDHDSDNNGAPSDGDGNQ